MSWLHAIPVLIGPQLGKLRIRGFQRYFSQTPIISYLSKRSLGLSRLYGAVFKGHIKVSAGGNPLSQPERLYTFPWGFQGVPIRVGVLSVIKAILWGTDRSRFWRWLAFMWRSVVAFVLTWGNIDCAFLVADNDVSNYTYGPESFKAFTPVMSGGDVIGRPASNPRACFVNANQDERRLPRLCPWFEPLSAGVGPWIHFKQRMLTQAVLG